MYILAVALILGISKSLLFLFFVYDFIFFLISLFILVGG